MIGAFLNFATASTSELVAESYTYEAGHYEYYGSMYQINHDVGMWVGGYVNPTTIKDLAKPIYLGELPYSSATVQSTPIDYWDGNWHYTTHSEGIAAYGIYLRWIVTKEQSTRWVRKYTFYDICTLCGKEVSRTVKK